MRIRGRVSAVQIGHDPWRPDPPMKENPMPDRKLRSRRTRPAGLVVAIIATTSAGLPSARGQEVAQAAAAVLERVEVRGQRNADKSDVTADPTALPGSTTRVTQGDIAKQAVTSYGDLLRPVTGLNINSFGIGGLGYGFSLRGFVDTEHGKDIAVFVDRVPANVSSAVQANGYIDLNPLIPETIASFDVLRGPVSALYGNHALGGTILFRTLNEIPQNRVDLSGGSWATGRALGMVGFKGDGYAGYGALEAYSSDGYRDNNRDRRINGFAKVAFALPSGTASVRLQLYDDAYGEPGYLNRAALAAGAFDAKATINPTDNGLAQQQNLVFDYAGNGEDRWSSTAYVLHRKLFRTRTTGGASIPGQGRLQRVGLDERVSFGAAVDRTTAIRGLGFPALLVAGATVYSDRVDVTRFDADLRGNRTTRNQDRRLDLDNPAVFAELQVKPLDALKLTAGARYDKFYNAIETGSADALPDRNTSPKPGQFSPKAGASYTIVDGVELYGNVARGLKAPSAYDELVVNPRLAVSKIRGTEFGIQAQDRDGTWRAVFDLWRTDQTGEVQNDPVTGDLINFGKTRRQGYDIEGRYRAIRNASGELTVFANYSRVSARLIGGAPADLYVTTVPEYTATLGVDATYAFTAAGSDHRVGLFVYDSFVGSKHLDAAGRFDSRNYQRISTKLTYGNSAWKGLTPYLTATIYPTSKLDETTFFSGGVVVTAPKAPVTAMAGVAVAFD